MNARSAMKNWFRRNRVARTIRDFNRIYYDGVEGPRLYETMTWLGVQVLKCPLDLWIYQEILDETRPEVIVETGVFAGGSALYLASICDLLDVGKILACDISLEKVHPRVRAHPRIELIEGSSVDPNIVEYIQSKCDGYRSMVILDSNHECGHVSEELRCYSPIVSQGCYLICEDTNVNNHPVAPDHGPGPFEAVQEFLRQHSEWTADKRCERLLLTFNPGGYLLRNTVGLVGDLSNAI